jgi:hypothetical protein
VTQLIGLYRETEYSPGRHRSNDAVLLEQVADHLRERRFDVELMTLDQAAATRPQAALVFSMCQGPRALGLLMEWEKEGARLINSPSASLNTYRDRLPSLMRDSGIPFPSTKLVATSNGVDAAAELGVIGAAGATGGVWLKRGDVHASVSEDVQWVDSPDRLQAGLRAFAARGVTRAAIQHHRAGDEIKFYGVADDRFFHWFYPGEVRGCPLDERRLQTLAQRAAAAAGLDIFGGDVIVAPDGELTLIDLNDWPSFAPCRDRASEAIAQHLMRRMDAVWNPGLVSSANESAI